MARVEIKGMEEFKKAIENAKKKIPKKIDEFVNKVGIKARDNVKVCTPVKSGHLRDNIFNKRTGKYEQTVYSNVAYAARIEYGDGEDKDSKRKKFYMFKKGTNQAIREIPLIAKEVFNEN